jgi:hypothetical protein
LVYRQDELLLLLQGHEYYECGLQYLRGTQQTLTIKTVLKSDGLLGTSSLTVYPDFTDRALFIGQVLIVAVKQRTVVK